MDNIPLTGARVGKEWEKETQISGVLSVAIQIKEFGEGRWDYSYWLKFNLWISASPAIPLSNWFGFH